MSLLFITRVFFFFFLAVANAPNCAVNDTLVCIYPAQGMLTFTTERLHVSV